MLNILCNQWNFVVENDAMVYMILAVIVQNHQLKKKEKQPNCTVKFTTGLTQPLFNLFKNFWPILKIHQSRYA